MDPHQQPATLYYDPATAAYQSPVVPGENWNMNKYTNSSIVHIVIFLLL